MTKPSVEHAPLRDYPPRPMNGSKRTHMKRILSLLTVASSFALAAPAVAQMYPGQDVVVNPGAIPAQGLLSPDQAGIVLRPPSQWHHATHRKRAAPAAATASADLPADTSLPDSAPPAHAKHNRHHAAPGQTSADSSSNPVPFTFGEDEPVAAPTSRVATQQSGPPAKAGKQDADDAGLAKRGAILFEHNATDPQPSQLNGIRLLASDLNSAIEAGATRIQLQAFGGSPGDKSSDARRISLKRALAIRQLLIDNGVPSERIVVRAMGGATDNGEPDRVDIYVRAS